MEHMKSRNRKLVRLLAILGCTALVVATLAYAGWAYLFSGLDYRPSGQPTSTPAATSAAGETPVPSTTLEPTVEAPHLDEILNILLIGTDSRHAENGNSDVMMVITVDRIHGTLKMMSIMRDLWVPIPGHGTDKINGAYAIGGAELAMKTVNQNFGLDVTKYVEVDIEGAEKLIDIAGGVDIDVTQPEIFWLNWNLDEENNAIFPDTPKVPYVTSAGLQHLVGRQAVCYARIRKLDSDFVRTQRERTVLKALLANFQKVSVVTKARMIQEGLSDCTTNLSPTEITWLGIEALPLQKNGVKEMLLPTEGDYKVYRGGTWCMVPDRNAMLPRIQRFIWEETVAFEPFAPIKPPYEGAGPTPTATPAPSGTPGATESPGPTAEQTPTPTVEPTTSPSPTATATPSA